MVRLLFYLVMISVFSYIKSCYYDSFLTTEMYTRKLLNNFNDTTSEEVEYASKQIKIRILSLFPGYNDYIIKLAPIHRNDNWSTTKEYDCVYITVGIFYNDTETNFKEKPFCFDRILLKIEDNDILIEEIKQIDAYINNKNIIKI